jgi:hypothetical protein
MKLYINKTQYGYSTTCKDRENNKCYLDMQFKKGEEPTTNQIEIHNAFFSCYKSKDGIKPKMVVMDYMDIGNDFEEGQAKSNSQILRDTQDQAFADFGDELSEEDVEINF